MKLCICSAKKSMVGRTLNIVTVEVGSSNFFVPCQLCYVIFTNCFKFLESIDCMTLFNLKFSQQLSGIFEFWFYSFRFLINVIQINWMTSPIYIVNVQIVENEDIVETEIQIMKLRLWRRWWFPKQALNIRIEII